MNEALFPEVLQLEALRLIKHAEPVFLEEISINSRYVSMKYASVIEFFHTHNAIIGKVPSSFRKGRFP